MWSSKSCVTAFQTAIVVISFRWLALKKEQAGLRGRVLIEQLRASIRALEQVPVSLASPPAPGAALSRPACSLSASHPSNDNRDNPLAALCQGGLHEIKPHAYRDTPAGLGFILSVIAQALTNCRGLVLWCLTTGRRPGMGPPLWAGPSARRSRPRTLPRCRDAHRPGERLGPGRRPEERRARRLRRPTGDQDPACRPPPRPCRASRPHPVSSPLPPRGGRGARHALPLAHCHGGKRPCPFRHGRPRHRLLAPLPRALPGRGAGRGLSRGGQP